MKKFSLLIVLGLCCSMPFAYAAHKHDLEDSSTVSVEFFKSVFGDKSEYVFSLVKATAKKENIILQGCTKGSDVVACGYRKYSGPEGDEIATNRNTTKTATGGSVSAKFVDDGNDAGKTIIIESAKWDNVLTVKQSGHTAAYHFTTSEKN